jgi:hypothetical protein
VDYSRHPGLFEYEVKWRMKFIKKNWLIGDKRVVREMLKRSKGCTEYRMVLLKWRMLARVPTFIVVLLWKLKQVLSGRSAAFPETTQIAQAKLANPRQAA